jgi:hypothetical protein
MDVFVEAPRAVLESVGIDFFYITLALVSIKFREQM